MKKKFFKLFKILVLSVLTLIIIVIASLYFSLNEKIPEGETGIKADQFALKIQEALNYQAYKDTDYLQWTFRNKHHYLWNKEQQTVVVKWDEYTVHLDLGKPQKSYLENKNVTEKESKKILSTALAYFNNDSFWVVAPFKLFDHGVTRKLVKLENNSNGLLVNYASGGTTPGDSYLWKVDQNYIPTSYQMWVSILPIEGIEATWSDWKKTESGTYLPQQHKLLGFGIPISNLRAWSN